ncbi:MAG: ABC transporter ATP-binding protein [Spirochaetaceae bacterium]|jgi:putative ABC transport system ATP-binding protein|nr:ABC transporter ATP-binding protein [Spirochaetaceae bacterium]
MTVVQAKNVVKDYGLPAQAVKGRLQGQVVHALRGVSLDFEEGEFAAIAGPSGSGKSTFLHLAGCLDTLSGGTMQIRGEDTAGLSKKALAFLRRKYIGFIFQAYNLIPVLSAEENISFPLMLLGLDKKEIQERLAPVIQALGLEGMEKRRPAELSGGQQQRVAIARALIKRPALILADEPTANLDSQTGREILEVMLDLNRTNGTTFIFSTHDKMVMEYARRVVMIRDGQIEADQRRSA